MLLLVQVEQRAPAYQPEVLQALDRRKAQHAQLQAISALLRPNLSYCCDLAACRLCGVEQQYHSGRAGPPSVPNYDAGLIFSWPFYEPTVGATTSASNPNGHMTPRLHRQNRRH